MLRKYCFSAGKYLREDRVATAASLRVPHRIGPQDPVQIPRAEIFFVCTAHAETKKSERMARPLLGHVPEKLALQEPVGALSTFTAKMNMVEI